jgi:Family of unknown function (DUF6433)
MNFEENMQLSISEILDKADKAPTVEEKIEVLRKNYSQQLVDVVMGAYDARIKWLLPPGPVPYTPTKLTGQEGNLYMETRRFYLFAEGGVPNLNQTKREMMFIQLLEHLNPADAVLVATIKDKKLPYKTITPDLIKMAWPDAPIVYIESAPALEAPKKEVAKAAEPIAVKPKRVPWNKGLTKENSERVRNNGLRISKSKLEKGKKETQDEQEPKQEVV